MAETTFGERLRLALADRGPLCVGIDPASDVVESWGRSDTVEGAEFVALSTLEAIVGIAGVIKPQVAFYERFGSAGFAVLERLIAEATGAGVLVVADAKRGDIGNTNEGYGAAWLDPRSPLGVDAVTVHPYLGIGAMGPLLARTEGTGRGLFVVVATSNDEGRHVQGARAATGEKVEDLLLRQISELNSGAEGLGAIGAVVGATRDRPEFDFANLLGPVLVPGVGAQGATPADVGSLFARCKRDTVAVNVARAIASCGPDRRAVADAAKRWRDELMAHLA